MDDDVRLNEADQRVLRYLDQKWMAEGGGNFIMISPAEIKRDNGLVDSQYIRMIARFRRLGVVKTAASDGSLFIQELISHYVEELDCRQEASAEQAAITPNRSPRPDSGVNIIHIGQLSHSQIQQGTVDSSQTSVENAAQEAKQPRKPDRSLILLAVATDVERAAVLSVAFHGKKATPTRRFCGDHTYLELGVHGGCDVLLVKTGMGAGGATGSLATLLDAIRDVSPSAIMMVGIAFGISQDRQRIGDILVSRQVLCYECQRVTETAAGNVTITPRGDRVSASPRLLDRFDAGTVGWTEAAVRFGLILSGDKLVDSPSFKQQLLALEPEAIGGEMEAAGMYASACKGKIDWIMVKAICDWGENKNNPNKKQDQLLAANNAAAFVFHVMRQGGLAHE